MSGDWMLEVLADLQSFAQANGLTMLEGKLEETIAVANASLKELKSRQSAGAGSPFDG